MEEAKLPWAVVIKSSRLGLRFAAVPVPPRSQKRKRVLTDAALELLQDIAFGTATFKPLRGNVSDIFKR